MVKNKKIIIMTIVIIIVILSFFIFSFQKGKNIKFTSEEIEWINQNEDKVLFMGYYNSRGEELFVRNLCKTLSIETGLRIVPYEDSWSNTLALLKSGKLPISSTLNKTAERMTYLNYTQPFKGLSVGVYSDINFPINRYKDMTEKKIGIVKNVQVLTNEFQEKYPNLYFDIILYDDIESMIKAIKYREIDGFISTKNYVGELGNFYYLEIPSLSRGNNHVGVHKDYPELYSVISKSVNHLIEIGWTDKVMEAIHFELEKQSLPFTDIETAYLNHKPTITVGIIDKYIVHGYEEGNIQYGIMADVFNKINFLSEIEFSYVFDSYDNLINNDYVDIIVTVGKPEYSKLYSNYIFRHSLSVVGKRGTSFIKEIFDLESYRVGILSQDPEQNYLTKQMPYIDIRKSDDVIELLKSVEKEETEYALLPSIMTDTFISDFKDLEKKGELGERFHYVMSKNNDEVLIHIMNKCLAVIDMHSIVSEGVSKYSKEESKNSKAILILSCVVILVLSGLIVNLIIKYRVAELQLMYTDNMTGIKNRIWFEKKLGNNIRKYTFFVFKLKEFHILKERYGQQIYDKALKSTIKTVREHLDEEDLFAVLDKEKFIIAKTLLTESKTEEFAFNLSHIFGEKILMHDMNYNL